MKGCTTQQNTAVRASTPVKCSCSCGRSRWEIGPVQTAPSSPKAASCFVSRLSPLLRRLRLWEVRSPAKAIAQPIAVLLASEAFSRRADHLFRDALREPPPGDTVCVTKLLQPSNRGRLRERRGALTIRPLRWRQLPRRGNMTFRRLALGILLKPAEER